MRKQSSPAARSAGSIWKITCLLLASAAVVKFTAAVCSTRVSFSPVFWLAQIGTAFVNTAAEPNATSASVCGTKAIAAPPDGRQLHTAHRRCTSLSEMGVEVCPAPAPTLGARACTILQFSGQVNTMFSFDALSRLPRRLHVEG